MSNNITVTFLGTTSGGGPTETRNCSSLVVDALGDGSLWMVDCAEGTRRQFETQPYRAGQPRLRMSQVSKIFITHMHADHTMGTLTFLRNILGIPKPEKIAPPNRHPPRVEIFGPRGIRRMLRMLWHITHTHSEFSYVVHELLFPGEEPSVAADGQQDGADAMDVRSESECIGRDIWCGDDGFWRGILDISPFHRTNHWGVIVDAGPIQHRDPCIGYVIREVPRQPLSRHSAVPRKLVILGDTYDPSPIIPLVHDDPPFASVLPETEPYGNGVAVRVPVTLLVHEATDAYLPPHVDSQGRTGKNRTPASVEAKALERGHSTPGMAGAFARKVAAERLVLNHIGARFPAPNMEYLHGPQTRFRLECMREIERQAAEGWNPKRRMQPQAAWDYLSIALPPNQSREWEPEREQEPTAGPSRTVTREVIDVDAGVMAVEPVRVNEQARGQGHGHHRGRHDQPRGGGHAHGHGGVPLTEDNLSLMEGAHEPRAGKRRAESSTASMHAADGHGSSRGQRGYATQAGHGARPSRGRKYDDKRVRREQRPDYI